METTVTGPDQYGRFTLTTDRYKVLVAPRHTFEMMRSWMVVDNAVAVFSDPELARLAAEEANLGELRYCKSVREGGSHPEVDDLYLRLHERYAAACLTITHEVLPLLTGIVDGAPIAAMAGAHFSRNAGCRDCKCSPGVVLGESLRFGELVVDVHVQDPI